jgi:hypothetical protein
MNTEALGLDPASLLLVMAQAQSSGILQGKAGTWFQGMFQSLSPKAGFASLLTGHGAEGRRQGLSQLGLVDASGAPTGLRMLQQNDWAGFIGTVKAHLDAVPQEQRMGLVSQAMGSTQAARGLMTLMLPGMVSQLPELRKEQSQFLGQNPRAVLDNLSDADPILKFQRTWEEMSNVLMDIGNIAMPTLLTGLHDFDNLLKAIAIPIKWLSEHMPHQGKASSGASGGLPSIFRGLPMIGHMLGGGSGSGGSAVIVPDSKYGAAPTTPVVGDGLLHKMSYTGDAFKRSDTWSDIGQGVLAGNTSMASFPILASANAGGGGGGAIILPRRGRGGGWGGGLNSVGPMGNLPISLSGLGSNSYIASRRAGFAAEMKDPHKRLMFAAMLLSEGSGVATAESAMNRADFTHKTLMQALNVGNDGMPLTRNGNFYGPIKHGQLPSFMAQLQRNPKLMAKMNVAIDGALGGSDSITGFTDQGMVTDPNGPWIMQHDHKKLGGNVFGDWNGPGGHAASIRWRQQFEAAAAANNKPPHFSIGDIGKAVGIPDSTAVIPPSKQQVHTTPVTMTLDGRVVAQSTMKHIVKDGNGPARGPRLADYTAVRPINV